MASIVWSLAYEKGRVTTVPFPLCVHISSYESRGIFLTVSVTRPTTNKRRPHRGGDAERTTARGGQDSARTPRSQMNIADRARFYIPAELLILHRVASSLPGVIRPTYTAVWGYPPLS
eukprot:4980718-Pleurochrysis_carterae.AAC.1